MEILRNCPRYYRVGRRSQSLIDLFTCPHRKQISAEILLYLNMLSIVAQKAVLVAVSVTVEVIHHLFLALPETWNVFR